MPRPAATSVIVPLGAAVLGQRVGDAVEPLVLDAVRRGGLDEILFQPEAFGCYDL